ncbi:unnamed protein product, partial [marine sediment metagenome]
GSGYTYHTYTFYASPYNSDAGATYTWILNPLLGNSVHPYGYYADIAFYNPYGFYQVITRAENTCGMTNYAWTGISISGNKSYSLFPNPADDYVEISIEESKMVENNINEYEVRIYNGMKIMVSQIKTRKPTLRINTRQFVSGVYFVHFIFNGKLQVEQLVISH